MAGSTPHISITSDVEVSRTLDAWKVLFPSGRLVEKREVRGIEGEFVVQLLIETGMDKISKVRGEVNRDGSLSGWQQVS